MKDAVKAIKCENVANFTSGFEYAFEILHRVRTDGIRVHDIVDISQLFNYFFSSLCLHSHSTTNRVWEVSATKQSC